tara:strand:- start:344 stop:1036 length:693 start_codon:yes stop_codon:yes gene_type:complete
LELSSQEIDAIFLSIKVSIWSVVFSLLPAVYIAYVLSRKIFWGRQALNIIIHIPLILPPVVTGYFLLILFSRTGLIGSFLDTYFGVTVAFHWFGAVLATAIMSFPLMVRAFRLGFENVDPKLELAAHSLGANRFMIFLTITLPLVIPALITGAVLGFAKSMGEFGATITFVSNIPGQTQTIPSAIFEFLQIPGNNLMTIRLVCLSLLISIVALYISEVLAIRLRQRGHSE